VKRLLPYLTERNGRAEEHGERSGAAAAHRLPRRRGPLLPRGGEGRRQRLFVIVGGDCVRAGDGGYWFPILLSFSDFYSVCFFLLFSFFFFFCPRLLIFISPAVIRLGMQNMGCSNFEVISTILYRHRITLV
jgi:hypothetical protein